MCGALVNDHTLRHYLDEPQYQVVWAALCELGVPLCLHPGAVPADAWHCKATRSWTGRSGAGRPPPAAMPCG